MKVAVIHYSGTGNVHALAEAIARGAEEAGAQVRLRKVRELAPQEAIESHQGWSDHAAATSDLPEASDDDLTWADAVVLGSPTRYGLVTAQLKQSIDGTGSLWAKGLLADGNPYGTTYVSGDRSRPDEAALAGWPTPDRRRRRGAITRCPRPPGPSEPGRGPPRPRPRRHP